MDRGQLEQAFRWKITAEMKLFKERVLQMEKEEIFALAYRIDCTIRLPHPPGMLREDGGGGA